MPCLASKRASPRSCAPCVKAALSRCQGVKVSRLISIAWLWRPRARLPPAMLFARGRTREAVKLEAAAGAERSRSKAYA
jgi:hypothetical protein